MQREGWPEYWGRIIGATVTLGVLSAIAGVVWGLALGHDIGSSAMWGGIIGGGIVFVMTLGIRRHAIFGMGLMFIGFWSITVVIGLIVWLVRTLMQ